MDGVHALIFKAGRRPVTSWANVGKFLRKISIFGVTGCQILMLKCPKMPLGFCPRTCYGILQRSPGRLNCN